MTYYNKVAGTWHASTWFEKEFTSLEEYKEALLDMYDDLTDMEFASDETHEVVQTKPYLVLQERQQAVGSSNYDTFSQPMPDTVQIIDLEAPAPGVAEKLKAKAEAAKAVVGEPWLDLPKPLSREDDSGYVPPPAIMVDGQTRLAAAQELLKEDVLHKQLLFVLQLMLAGICPHCQTFFPADWMLSTGDEIAGHGIKCPCDFAMTSTEIAEIISLHSGDMRVACERFQEWRKGV